MDAMRVSMFAFLVFALCFPMAAIARRDAGPPEWTFDNVVELADWQDYHDLSPSDTITKVRDSRGNERTVLRITSTGENPYIYPGGAVPNWEAFDGYDHRTMYIGVRVSESDIWQIDYINIRSGQYDEAVSRTFRVDATRDFLDLEFDMQWNSMIRGFRIHPGTSKNKETEIDYISVRGPLMSNQPPRTLATTWGRVKDLF